MVECDNPKCNVIGKAEWPDTFLKEEELKGVESVSPPYGWPVVRVDYFGSGPTVNVVACQNKCIGPAIDAELERMERDGET